MRMQERIETQLRAAFAPEALDLIDESSHHAGHAGARAGGETHYRVAIVSAAFAGASRVQRHRMIYAALAAEIADGVHALSFDARAPGEG
jgi:BolA protein